MERRRITVPPSLDNGVAEAAGGAVGRAGPGSWMSVGFGPRTDRGFVPSVRLMGGLLGPARGPASLRSAPRACGAAAGGPPPARGPRLAASLPGPRARARVFAPRARGAAAGVLRPGARTAPRRYALWARELRIRSLLRGRAAPLPGALRPGARAAPRLSALGPWTGTASPLLPLAISTVRGARGPAGPAAPARRNPRCGDGRATCPALPGLRQAGPSPRVERRGDESLPLAFLQCDGGAVLQAHSYHPSWDK
jgi:hypothetical protein